VQDQTAGAFAIGDAPAAGRAAISHADDRRAAADIAAHGVAANDLAARNRAAGGRALDDPAEDRQVDDHRATHGRAAEGPAAEDRTVAGRLAEGSAAGDPVLGESAADPRVGEALAAQGHAADDRGADVDPVAGSAGADMAWPDLELVSPWADSRVAGKASAIGPVGGRAAAPDAVGCVVVLDVVRAGAAQSEVGGLLREVGDRVTRRIPTGARLRGEADGSALSVVLSGRERSVAIDWMHQTLPAVFAEVADLETPSPWAKGTALRAAVHDTNGPVGAQLLQRLDLVAPQVDGGRARHDPRPPVVRWGVPILAGSGGRRRRPDDGYSTEVPGDDCLNSRRTDETARPETPPAEVAHGPTAHVAGGQAEADGVAAPVSANSQKQTHEEESEFSVEGLGLADLLAGALAAYRGI
jgi:hypothetical protein